MPDREDPTKPRHAVSDVRRGDSADEGDRPSLHNEYTGEAVRDGIPANGTQPTDARGPDDVGA